MAQVPKQVFTFLKNLRSNNNRPWFEENREKYEQALEEVKKLVKEIRKGLDKNDHIEAHKIFRIYRDVRFSKDKTPYKTNFGISFKRATAALRGGYYLNIEPGNTFVGGGFWGPNSQDLKRIRDEFERDDERIRKILSSKKFKDLFGSLGGEEVKTAPRGYEKDHPAIDLIKKKQYLVSRTFTDKEVLSESFSDEVVKSFHGMRPFFDYMSEILTTNLDGESLI